MINDSAYTPSFNKLDHRDILKNQQCSSTCRLGCLGRPKFDLRVSFASTYLPPSVSTIHTIIQFISVVSSSLQVCLTQFLAAAAGIIAEFHLVSSFQKGEPRSSSYVAFNLSGAAAVQPPVTFGRKIKFARQGLPSHVGCL